MPQQRSIGEKVSDATSAYHIFRELITPEEFRTGMAKITEQQTAAAIAGDIRAYEALIAGSIKLQQIVAANDRAALMAATMLAQSGVARPILEDAE